MTAPASTGTGHSESQLKKTITWKDGVVLSLCMPGFLLPSVGFAVSLLGGWGTVAVWLGVVIFGYLHANIYAELAAAFPTKSGGIALYVDEAFHRVSRLFVVVAAFGYWFGWSAVLAINGILVGLYIQAAWLTNVHLAVAKVDLFPPVVGTIMLAGLLAVNLLGLRPGVLASYILGALTMIPLTAVALVPWLTGKMHLDFLNNATMPGNGAGFFTLAGLGLFFGFWYLGIWSAYAAEVCAAFAPEYKDTARETPKALRYAGVLQILIFGLVPIALVGTIGQKAITGAPYTVFVPVLQSLFGQVGSFLVLVMLVSSLVLSANIATADGARALYQLSRDGLTIKWLGHLNDKGTPSHGMTWDLVIQVILMFLPYVLVLVGINAAGTETATPIWLVAASNFGYVLSHILATLSFLLLRRSRPDLVRPFKLGPLWLGIAWFLVVFDILVIPLGAFNPSLGYGVGPFIAGLALLGISVLLYLYRRKIEDPRDARAAAATVA